MKVQLPISLIIYLSVVSLIIFVVWASLAGAWYLDRVVTKAECQEARVEKVTVQEKPGLFRRLVDSEKTVVYYRYHSQQGYMEWYNENKNREFYTIMAKDLNHAYRAFVVTDPEAFFTGDR